jgi:hypothetical protein
MSRILVLHPQPQTYDKNVEDVRNREIQQHTRELSIRVENIEAAVVPVGGTTGQVLKKNSSGDYDYDWAADDTGATSVAWGDITGTLASQTDLNSALGGKSNTGHTHPQSDVTNLTTDLAAKANSNGTNFVIENRTSDPGSPATGQIWLRTDL